MYGVPPVTPLVDVKSYPDQKKLDYQEYHSTAIQQIQAVCKYQMPCGLCELTKELCKSGGIR